MKTTLKIIALLYLALVCQAGLARGVSLYHMQPSFLALLLVGLVVNWSGNKLLFLVAMVGLADDALRGEALGLGMFLAVLGTVISLWKQEEKRTDIAFGRILFLVSWYVIGVNVCVMLLDGKLHWWQNVLLQSGGTIVYTTLIWVSWTVARKLIRRFWSGSGPKVAWR